MGRCEGLDGKRLEVHYSLSTVQPHPALLAMQEYQFAMMMRGVRLRELRCIEFMARTGLPAAEIVLVQLPNGNQYPQWRGATAGLARATEAGDDD